MSWFPQACSACFPLSSAFLGFGSLDVDAIPFEQGASIVLGLVCSVTVGVYRSARSDRLRGMLESRTLRMSARHPIFHRIARQAKFCNFHRRSKLMQRTAREGVNKVLGYKVELRGVAKKDLPIVTVKENPLNRIFLPKSG